MLIASIWLGVAYAAYTLIRYFVANPTANIPGPFATRLSSFWLALQCRLGRRSAKVHQLHQHYGDVIRLTANHVSVNKLEAVQEIFHNDKDFLKGPFYDPFKTPTPPILATYDHKKHAEHRKILSPAFSLRSMREFEGEMNKHYLKWKRQLLNLGDKRIDLNDWADYLAFDLISQYLFGKAFGFVERGEDFLGFITKMERRLNSATALGILPRWAQILVMRMPFDKFWRDGNESIVAIRKSVRAAIDERRAGHVEGNENGKDLLSYMFNAKSEMSDGQVLSEMTGFVIGGSDSTAASIIHFVDFVSRDEVLQRKVQREIDEVFPGTMDDEWVPSYTETQQLKYMNAVVYEVLRLRPTAGLGLERYAMEKTLTFDGHVIPPGTLVSVPTYSLHRNSEIFPDPEAFRPERWLAKDTTQQTKTFNLFSQGARNCIGQNFAWMEMMKSLTMLFKLWNIRRAVDGETEIVEGFFLKAQECWVTMERR